VEHSCSAHGTRKGLGPEKLFKTHPSSLLPPTRLPLSLRPPPPNSLFKFCIHRWMKPLMRSEPLSSNLLKHPEGGFLNLLGISRCNPGDNQGEPSQCLFHASHLRGSALPQPHFLPSKLCPRDFGVIPISQNFTQTHV
jgi:hypothetical protein